MNETPRKASGIWPASLIIVCLLGVGGLVAGGLWYANKRVVEHEANKAQMKAAIDSINDSLSDNPTGKSATSDSDVTKPGANETSEQAVARVMSDVAKMIADGSRKGSELQGRFAGLPLQQVFSPDTWVSKPEIGKARATLLQADGLIGEYEATFKGYFSKAEALLKTLPEAERAQGLAGYHAGADRSIQLTNQYVSTERNIIRIGNELLDLAESQLGKTESRGGSILFQDEAALQRFQSLQQELMAAAQKEGEIISEMQQVRMKAQMDMSNLRNTVNRQ